MWSTLGQKGSWLSAYTTITISVLAQPTICDETDLISLRNKQHATFRVNNTTSLHPSQQLNIIFSEINRIHKHHKPKRNQQQEK
ncbi:hypothetical protein DPMN_127861 [Dreissena polymorpha]|uniref:Uncharacterized protein n=1 Tax=Dreissena polymorpha TaxID=45954 RepID=A0A9D4H009_DREPO|nr:hypothetical protein DPMN_127861 [Dreissena polymorpha]